VLAILNLDVDGNKQCSKVFGGSRYDYASSIVGTPNGEFVIAGETLSNDGIVSNNHGSNDAWVFKSNFNTYFARVSHVPPGKLTRGM
jgi:hypothetical protein